MEYAEIKDVRVRLKFKRGCTIIGEVRQPTNRRVRSGTSLTGHTSGFAWADSVGYWIDKYRGYFKVPRDAVQVRHYPRPSDRKLRNK